MKVSAVPSADALSASSDFELKLVTIPVLPVTSTRPVGGPTSTPSPSSDTDRNDVSWIGAPIPKLPSTVSLLNTVG